MFAYMMLGANSYIVPVMPQRTLGFSRETVVEQRSICTQAIQLIEHHVDLLGHRIGQLDGAVESTVRQVAERWGLSEYPVEADHPQGHIDALNFAFCLVSGAMRDDCGELIELGDAMSDNLLGQTAVSLEQCLELLESVAQIASSLSTGSMALGK